MNSVFVIFRKEFRGFVLSPSFILVCAMCMTVLSWVYPSTLNAFDMQMKNAVYQQGLNPQAMNIHYGVFLKHLSILNLMLILIVPALTMRLFSEEKKVRTFDLLLTSPVTSAQIVVGKYLAALASIAFLMFIAFLYPAVTSLFASFSWSLLIIAFLGIFVLSAVYAAIDLFCSALTESAIIAYVMAVIMNLSLWFVGVGVDVVDSATARAVFEHISLNAHLSSLVEGTVRSSALVFFASLISFSVSYPNGSLNPTGGGKCEPTG